MCLSDLHLILTFIGLVRIIIFGRVIIMITNISIENFMGIENKITISCLANNKIARKKTVPYSTYDNVNILNTIGIIGCNGSGKTSILNALSTIKTFVLFPSRR